MDAGEVRERLRAAIAERDANPTDLSVRLLKRAQGYISDFLTGKKHTLAAAESAALENELRLRPGSLVVARRPTAPSRSSSPTDEDTPRARAPTGNSLTGRLRSRESVETPGPQNVWEIVEATVRKVFPFAADRFPTEDEVLALVRSVIAYLEAQKAQPPRRTPEDG